MAVFFGGFRQGCLHLGSSRLDGGGFQAFGLGFAGSDDLLGIQDPFIFYLFVNRRVCQIESLIS